MSVVLGHTTTSESSEYGFALQNNFAIGGNTTEFVVLCESSAILTIKLGTDNKNHFTISFTELARLHSEIGHILAQG